MQPPPATASYIAAALENMEILALVAMEFACLCNHSSSILTLILFQSVAERCTC